MKSATSIQVAMTQITEFFAAIDHLKITDEKMIQKLFKERLLDYHCVDMDDPCEPLDPEGSMKNDLFQYEMLYREMST